MVSPNTLSCGLISLINNSELLTVLSSDGEGDRVSVSTIVDSPGVVVKILVREGITVIGVSD